MVHLPGGAAAGRQAQSGVRLEQMGACLLLTVCPLPVLPLIPSLLGNLGLSASAGEGGEERATGKQTNGSLRLGWGGACAAMEKREAVLWGRRGR